MAFALLPFAKDFEEMLAAYDRMKIVLFRLCQSGALFGSAENARFVGKFYGQHWISSLDFG
jgi:hypothetical protein